MKTPLHSEWVGMGSLLNLRPVRSKSVLKKRLLDSCELFQPCKATSHGDIPCVGTRCAGYVCMPSVVALTPVQAVTVPRVWWVTLLPLQACPPFLPHPAPSLTCGIPFLAQWCPCFICSHLSVLFHKLLCRRQPVHSRRETWSICLQRELFGLRDT